MHIVVTCSQGRVSEIFKCIQIFKQILIFLINYFEQETTSQSPKEAQILMLSKFGLLHCEESMDEDGCIQNLG